VPESAQSLADKLARLGLARDDDLVLHLPLRYEDHTRLTPLADARPGDTVQVEGVVVRTNVQYRPRRQLVSLLRGDDVVCTLEDGRFLLLLPGNTGDEGRQVGERLASTILLRSPSHGRRRRCSTSSSSATARRRYFSISLRLSLRRATRPFLEFQACG